MKNYYVYIMTNRSNKVLYTGVTGNIEQRIYQHKLKSKISFALEFSEPRVIRACNFSAADVSMG
ncbi:MAG: GIY-YIG nuclease family protein [Deltaproteobacteria bacterium]|nr:GIY-YIG nuclease family protein [Deltaproteobacteria bacterium]